MAPVVAFSVIDLSSFVWSEYVSEYKILTSAQDDGLWLLTLESNS